MEENNKLIVFEQDKLISKVANSLRIANKLLPIKSEPELIPYRKGNKWGFCTPDNNIIIDCIYDDAYQFIEGLARVKKNGKYGFINRKGFQVIPLIYKDAFDFDNGHARVVFNEKHGKINNINFFEEVDYEEWIHWYLDSY